jgi:hypothetical protein
MEIAAVVSPLIAQLLIPLLQVFVHLDVLRLTLVTTCVIPLATMPLVTTTVEIATVVAHFKLRGLPLHTLLQVTLELLQVVLQVVHFGTKVTACVTLLATMPLVTTTMEIAAVVSPQVTPLLPPLLQVFVHLDVGSVGAVTAGVTPLATMPLVTTTMEIVTVVAHFKLRGLPEATALPE